jgi:hypothetical protein
LEIERISFLILAAAALVFNFPEKSAARGLAGAGETQTPNIHF